MTGKILREHRSIAVISALFFIFVVAMGLNRYFNFYASFDQGIFNQVFWNNLHGRLFQSSLSSTLSEPVLIDGLDPIVNYRRLGQHFTPALLLWTPLYFLYPKAETLVVLQAGIITAGGLMLYLLAQRSLSAPLATLVSASFYGSNAVLGPALGNFSDLCQVPLFFFGVLLAVEKRFFGLAWILAIGLLAIREDVGILLFGIGLYFFLSRTHLKLGLAFCGISVLYVVTTTVLIMPLFSDDNARRFLVTHFSQYIDSDRASTIDLLISFLSRPGLLIREFFTPFGEKVRYTIKQLLPFAFFPILAPPAWIVAGLPLSVLFLQDSNAPNPPLHINMRYAIFVVPGLCYGVLHWWRQKGVHLSRFMRRISIFGWIACISLSVLLTLRSSPHQVFYFLGKYQPYPYQAVETSWMRQREHARHIQSLIDAIPKDASVAASTFIAPHIASRREAIRFVKDEVAATALIDDTGELIQVEYVITDIWFLGKLEKTAGSRGKRYRELREASIRGVEERLADGTYGIQAIQDGVVLLRRATLSAPDRLEQWEQLRQADTFATVAPLGSGLA